MILVFLLCESGSSVTLFRQLLKTFAARVTAGPNPLTLSKLSPHCLMRLKYFYIYEKYEMTNMSFLCNNEH
jgi:hypothetical protein